MSLVKTAKEWIEDLQKLKPCTKLVGNLYSARDLRNDIERDLCSAQNADELTDDEVIERFRTEYDDNEDDAYYDSLSTIASNIDVDYEEKHKEDEEDDEEEEN